MLTIVSVPIETLKNREGKDQKKTILYVSETRRNCFRSISLTSTRLSTITGDAIAMTGPGHDIQLYPTMNRNEMQDC